MAEYINKENIISKIENVLKKYRDEDGARLIAYFAVQEFVRLLKIAPTADVVEVKHGYWIRHIDDIFPADSTLECSVCHEEECIFLCGDNYCPNCGAKMDLKEGADDDKL